MPGFPIYGHIFSEPNFATILNLEIGFDACLVEVTCNRYREKRERQLFSITRSNELLKVAKECVFRMPSNTNPRAEAFPIDTHIVSNYGTFSV